MPPKPTRSSIANVAPKGTTNPNTPLTEKQRQFVNCVAAGLGVVAAARTAGFAHPDKVASQMLRKAHIKNALVDARKKYEASTQMTRKRVMDGYLDAISQAKTLADPQAQIQGWNSIAKMCGYFEPIRHKVEISVNGKVQLEQLQKLPDHELLKLAEEEDENVIDVTPTYPALPFEPEE